MRIRFFGVRGSLPAPALPSQIKSKISAIIRMMTPDDLKSVESRERFIADIPPWLYGTVGGNSPCVSVQFNEDPAGDVLVFDSGSGIRELGISLEKEEIKPSGIHIFFSHFHLDHCIGLPFFNYANDKNIKLNFYSPVDELEATLGGHMVHPYFPIRIEALASQKLFHTLKGPLKLPSATITYKEMNHPGVSYAYRVDDGNKSFIYSTDTELTDNDFTRNDEKSNFFHSADVLVMDSQYTQGEAIEKYNWGHSAFCKAVDFAIHWEIGHLVLFHHDPCYDDKKLYDNLQIARSSIKGRNIRNLKISLAEEEMEIIL